MPRLGVGCVDALGEFLGYAAQLRAGGELWHFVAWVCVCMRKCERVSVCLRNAEKLMAGGFCMILYMHTYIQTYIHTCM